MYVVQGATFDGAVYMKDNVSINGTLGVTGAATFSGHVTISSGKNLTLTAGNVTLTDGDLTFSSGDIMLSASHDIKVDGHGLQQQIAYLYSYLFNQSYASIVTAGQGRPFDQDGDPL